MSIRPWRKAALRTVSSSSASISMPTGSNRTVCVLPMFSLAAAAAAQRPGRPRGRRPGRSTSWRRASGRGALRRRPPGGAAGLVVRDVLLALLGRHLVEQDVRALERDALAPRPASTSSSGRGSGAAAGRACCRRRGRSRESCMMSARSLPWWRVSHSRWPDRRPMDGVARPSYSGAEGDLVRPVAGLRAVRADLAVDLVDHRVLTDQARDHAGPAAVRVLVVGVLERDRLVAVLDGESLVALPPLAVLVVPARVLVLEPLEVRRRPCRRSASSWRTSRWRRTGRPRGCSPCSRSGSRPPRRGRAGSSGRTSRAGRGRTR